MSDGLKCICIACRKQMKNYMSDGLQPDNGLAFASTGHYGSCIFDPMDGSRLEICVCDGCIAKAATEGIVGIAEVLQLARYKLDRWIGDDHSGIVIETDTALTNGDGGSAT